MQTSMSLDTSLLRYSSAHTTLHQSFEWEKGETFISTDRAALPAPPPTPELASEQDPEKAHGPILRVSHA